jgi:hypothetical protein
MTTDLLMLFVKRMAAYEHQWGQCYPRSILLRHGTVDQFESNYFTERKAHLVPISV